MGSTRGGEKRSGGSFIVCPRRCPFDLHKHLDASCLHVCVGSTCKGRNTKGEPQGEGGGGG